MDLYWTGIRMVFGLVLDWFLDLYWGGFWTGIVVDFGLLFDCFWTCIEVVFGLVLGWFLVVSGQILDFFELVCGWSLKGVKDWV